MHRSIPAVPQMENPGLYEFLSAMRRSVYFIGEIVEEHVTPGTLGARRIMFGKDATEFVAYSPETEKFEFYRGGVLVYSIPP